MLETIRNFFAPGSIPNIILDAYLTFIIVFFITKFLLRTKYFISFMIPLVLVGAFYLISTFFKLPISNRIYQYCLYLIPLYVVIIFAPDIHKVIDGMSAKTDTTHYVKGTDDNKQAIADAAMFLSSRKIGALITIEKHKLLDQYAEKAIVMNADISKELLINIFSPLTPLHDGAVIIKGNKIRCAGAYYVLSQRDTLDKTVGSRHRAALGIAEVTDSVTVVVSEETGKISITYSGIIISINDREKLLEYLDLAME